MTIASKSISIDPLFFGLPVLAISIVAVIYIALLLWRKWRFFPLRFLTLLFLFLVAINPVIVEENRRELPDIAMVIVDSSTSMALGKRKQRSEAVKNLLHEKLVKLPNLETRVVDYSGRDLGDHLRHLHANVPTKQIGAYIIVTDAAQHLQLDPDSLESLDKPVHLINVGDPEHFDRKLSLVSSPRYALVKDKFQIKLRLDEYPTNSNVGNQKRIIRYAFGQGAEQIALASPGEEFTLNIQANEAGPQFFTAKVENDANELTILNNQIGHEIHIVRDRLRVALISGLPHQGGRTWRDLLKADPAVDLIHFTILRPPHKRGVAPNDELALVRFPIDELFVKKLKEFDLLIFDRYVRRGIVPTYYIDNVRRYVTDFGGAALISAGPDYATSRSLHRTPLSIILPVRPLDEVVEKTFTPIVTKKGRLHPITSLLVQEFGPTAETKDVQPDHLQAPSWGPWHRYTKGQAVSGDILMVAENDDPLLVVDRVGNGRVAQLMSDQIWLWARDVDNGGPAAELLRHTAHWLMKEPDLDERKLRFKLMNNELTVINNWIDDEKSPLIISKPDGSELQLEWQKQDASDGSSIAKFEATQNGLYKAVSGLSHGSYFKGVANDPEITNPQSDPKRIERNFTENRGNIIQINQSAAPDFDVTKISPTSHGRSDAKDIYIRSNGSYETLNQKYSPLITPLILALIGLSLFALMWWREGKSK